MKIEINTPNDYGCEADMEDLINEIYEGDEQVCENDHGRTVYDKLAEVAKNSGLTYIKDSDFGAVWEGTQDQVEVCKNTLPKWAGHNTWFENEEFSLEQFIL